MDDDPVLRELGDDLAREDPRLAAALTGPVRAPRPRLLRWGLAALALLAVALLVPPTVFLGVTALLLVVASPVLACWWCVFPEDGPASGPS